MRGRYSQHGRQRRLPAVKDALRAAIALLFALLAGWTSIAVAQDPATPRKPLDDGKTHLGVASCAGTTCHSRQAATGTRVQQNEVVLWGDQTAVSGAHARAYRVLTSTQGRAIAANLGIGAADKAPQCLSCHTHNVATARRGAQFQLSEGVTCEACHGGASEWLTSHYAAGATHADNVSKGLYPTDDPVARASLCLDCHFGSTRPNQFVTHRMMGAGHPRISFELDLFTNRQQHHTVDADYAARKTVAGGVKTWAVGQAMAMSRSARLFADSDIGVDGLFPELYFFDCHACHQPISNDPKALSGWRPNPSRPLGPGTPVYNDANIIMLRAIVAEFGGTHAASLNAASARLHAASRGGRSQAVAAALQLATLGDELRDKFAATTFTREQSIGILNRVLDNTLATQYTNYAAGEQAVIAVDTFIEALIADGVIGADIRQALLPSIEAAYEAVQEANRYNPDALRSALQRIASRTRTL